MHISAGIRTMAWVFVPKVAAQSTGLDAGNRDVGCPAAASQTSLTAPSVK